MRIIPDTYRHISLVKPIDRAVSLTTRYDRGIIDTENVVYSIKDFIEYIQLKYKDFFNTQSDIFIYFLRYQQDDMQYEAIIDEKNIKFENIIFNHLIRLPIKYTYAKGYIGKMIFDTEYNFINVYCWIAKNKKDAKQIMLDNQTEIQEQLRLWSITKFKDKLEEII